MQAGRLPLPSPGATVITVLTPVLAMTSASVGVEPLKTTMISLPESLSWCSSSRGVYSGFTFTCTAPARAMPRKAIGKARKLGIITATRSPFLTPSSCCSQAAKAARQPVDVGIAQRLAEGAERGLVGEALHRRVEHVHDRWVGVGVDVGRDGVVAVGREPGFRGHHGASVGCRLRG